MHGWLRGSVRCPDGPGGWVAIAAVVAVVDIVGARETGRTLSSCFRLAPRRWTIPLTVITVLHLFGLMPKWCDPYEILGKHLGISTRSP